MQEFTEKLEIYFFESSHFQRKKLCLEKKCACIVMKIKLSKSCLKKYRWGTEYNNHGSCFFSKTEFLGVQSCVKTLDFGHKSSKLKSNQWLYVLVKWTLCEVNPCQIFYSLQVKVVKMILTRGLAKNFALPTIKKIAGNSPFKCIVS